MAKTIVKPWVKVFGVIVVVAAIVCGLYSLGQGGNVTDVLTKNSKKSDKTIVVGTNTYAGFLPFMYLNGGLEPNDESYIYKNYGLKLKIVVQDDFQAGRAAFKNGNIDVIYCTADAFPVEMSENSDMSDARFFNISNWSRGADAIVVNKNVNTVGDLVGKIVACSEGTASHTLLLNTLETNGLSWADVNTDSKIKRDKVNLKVVSSGLDAAAIFKAGQCDAAVVFSPDDQDIVNTIKGSKVLVSTKQASSIICDGLIAKASYLEENTENVRTLLAALFEANALMNTDPQAVATAAKAFAKAYGTDEEFAISGSQNIYYTTLADAGNFFGLNTSYTGVKGDELYSKMSRTYEGLNLCRRPLSWRKVSDPSLIETLLEDPSVVKGNQNAEKPKVFTAPTVEMETALSMSTKKLTIDFPVNGDVLNNDAKALIDREFVSIAKEFSGARIRIEGNTDNTGNANYNVALSKRRAQAVANYLVKEYGFDSNRFIIVGNGPEKAIRDGVVGSNQNYRTTDFQLVNE